MGCRQSRPNVPRRNRRGRIMVGEYGVRPIRALILTPTRELAVQIGDSFSDYGKYVGLKHLTIFGGVKQGPQVEALSWRRGYSDSYAGASARSDRTEVRRTRRDYAFRAGRSRPDARHGIRRRHQTSAAAAAEVVARPSFFSATMPADIVALSKSMLTDPVRVEVTPVASAVDAIDQRVYFVE